MSCKDKLPPKKRQDDVNILTLVSVLAVVFVASVAIWGYSEPKVFSDNGAWGDFFGGLLNPILSSLTFLGVIYTIHLQMEELSDSKIELRRSADALENQIENMQSQRFEQTFHNLMSMQEQIVNSIDLVAPSSGAVTSGRDCFAVFYTRLNKKYKVACGKHEEDFLDGEILKSAYHSFWSQHQKELSHYFRFTYNFLRFIDESEHSNISHRRLVRSLFSDHELLIIFYNSLTEDGRSYQKYAENFALFDNMPMFKLLKTDHASLMPKGAFGENRFKTPDELRNNLSGV